MTGKRPYRMSARAKAQDETRQRIVEATMQLHEELGPRSTTISAIAERAGVQRLTVYRHFPDETAVFQACTAHWLSLNPPPDPSVWAALPDPTERVRTALTVFYRYYGATRRMWTVSHRDVASVPALQGPMAAFAGFVNSVAEDLTAPYSAEPAHPAVRATIGHALAFPTWEDLDARGLDLSGKVAVALRWIQGVRDTG